MVSASPKASTAGKLLVAPPALRDPNFTGTVVLMLLHNDDGAFGLVLTRPSINPVTEFLPSWADRCAAPALVFGGGPVQPTSAIGLVKMAAPTEGVAMVSADLGTADLELDPVLIPGVLALRVFAGYSGWAGGQLEGELELGGWIVVGARPDDAFDPDPSTLWERVVARQGGVLGSLARTPTPDWN